MDHLSRLPRRFRIAIRPDKDGYLGRECPNEECSIRYFKITPGTGVQEPAPCHCPYCGYVGEHNEFFTRDQVKHAHSVALHKVTDAFMKDLKALVPRNQPHSTGGFGIRISLEVKGRPHPVFHYREKDLETEVVCDQCGLRYAIYGVFAFCPDCGTHNSLQMLNKNLDLAGKKLALAPCTEPDLAETIITDALHNTVAAFDAFGRETCRVHARAATAPDRAERLSFQNLSAAQSRLQELFGIHLAAAVTEDEWETACRSFQKRHLFTHKAGVVDQDYIAKTNDTTAVVGRKIPITAHEVLTTIGILRRTARGLSDHLDRASTTHESEPP